MCCATSKAKLIGIKRAYKTVTHPTSITDLIDFNIHLLRFIKRQLQFEHWIDVKIIARRWVFDNVTIFKLVNISLCYMSLMWHKIDRLLIQPFIFHRQPPSMNLHDTYYPSTLTSFFSSIAASILSKTLLLIPHIFTVPLCHLCVPVYLTVIEAEAGWRWQSETPQQTKWVCLAVTGPREVLKCVDSMRHGDRLSCQTKPVKCKTNLPIHFVWKQQRQTEVV